MEREIRFRAWNKRTNEYNNYVEIYCYKDGSTGCSAGTENNNPIGNSENFILEQFTGLNDKNGNPIFDGDVCMDITGKKRIVLYEFGSWSWQYYEDPESDWEIIGNIHLLNQM